MIAMISAIAILLNTTIATGDEFVVEQYLGGIYHLDASLTKRPLLSKEACDRGQVQLELSTIGAFLGDKDERYSVLVNGGLKEVGRGSYVNAYIVSYGLCLKFGDSSTHISYFDRPVLPARMPRISGLADKRFVSLLSSGKGDSLIANRAGLIVSVRQTKTESSFSFWNDGRPGRTFSYGTRELNPKVVVTRMGIFVSLSRRNTLGEPVASTVYWYRTPKANPKVFRRQHVVLEVVGGTAKGQMIALDVSKRHMGFSLLLLSDNGDQELDSDVANAAAAW